MEFDETIAEDRVGTARQVPDIGQTAAGRFLIGLVDDHGPGWASYRIGNLAALDENWAKAQECYDEAIGLGCRVAGLFFARAHALDRQGAARETIARSYLALVSANPDDLDAVQKQTIEQAADDLFNAGVLDDAAALFAYLHATGWNPAFANLKLADIAYRNHQPEMAIALLDRFEPDPSGWTDHIRANALLALGRADEAADLVRGLTERFPGEAGFFRQFFLALHQAGRTSELLRFTDFIDGLSDRDQIEFRMRTALARRSFGEVLDLHAANADHANAITDDIVARAITGLIHTRDLDQLVREIDKIKDIPANGALVGAGLACCYFALDRWEDADRLLSAYEQTDPLGVVGARFEYLCLTGRLDEAGALLADKQVAPLIPTQALPTVISYHAELGQWTDAIEVFVRRVAKEYRAEIPHGVLHTICEAARRTGRHRQLLLALDRTLAANPDLSPSVARFRDQIAEELIFFRMAEGIASTGDLRVTNEFRLDRIDFFGHIFADSPSADQCGRILVCTDANYLIGACVTISSLLRGNAHKLHDCEIVVCVANDVEHRGRHVLHKIGEYYRVKLRVLSEDQFIDANPGLRTSYAHFGPGHSLSRAAYFRIFAIDHLRREGAAGRILYLDADTIIEPGIEALFEFDLGGHPLAARLDDSNQPGVLNAIRLLEIADDRYFNSGVMLFDMDHPHLEPAIRRALDAASTMQDRLSFHDQCALNLAFRHDFRDLPAQFNAFVRYFAPPGKMQKPQRMVVVWHYLDRPKPWDLRYESHNGARWMTEFAALRAVLDAAEMRWLMDLAHPRFHPVRGDL